MLRITDYVKYPGIVFGSDGDFQINGEHAGCIRFGGIEEFEDKDYLVLEMILIEDKFKRKGIYSSIIKGAAEWTKEIGNGAGAISFQFDLSSEQERSEEANLFWKGLTEKGEAVPVDFFDGESDTIVYHTI